MIRECRTGGIILYLTMKCLWVELGLIDPWVLGGGDREIPQGARVRRSSPSLYYKVHPKTVSSIQITPIACFFVSTHIYIHSLIGLEFIEHLLCANLRS